MEENYVHIFCYFVGRLMQDEKLSLKDALIILKKFQSVCRQIKSREDLIKFIDDNLGLYWEMKELKSRLANKNYIFS